MRSMCSVFYTKKFVQVEVIFRQLLPLTGQDEAEFHFRFFVTDLT
jgi:hypothetical protein